jgi:hypothetical protein
LQQTLKLGGGAQWDQTEFFEKFKKKFQKFYCIILAKI